MTSKTSSAPNLALVSQQRALRWMLLFGLLAIGSASIALAGPREQAERIHNRLAGVPPSDAVLTQMTNAIAAAPTTTGPINAANIAMQDPHFYTVTLKNWAAPWTNRDQSAFVPLNDYIALVIGMVRDNVPFNQILQADMLYFGNKIATPPSATSNAHYEALEQAMRAPTFDPFADLTQSTQSGTYGTPPAATAGAMTTRAAAEAFFVAGTNRAMFRFTLMNHLCMDMEQVQDTSIVPDRIRQDVSRSPGGDSRVFLNNCIGCHAGMDPMAQAFAYYDFDETTTRMNYTGGPNPTVQPKYFNNDETFADGFVTPDDSWHNHWREGQNALLGWNTSLPGSGNGAKSLGAELAGSRAFAECQVTKVFKAVCLRPPGDAADRNQVAAMTAAFSNGYDLKPVFADSAKYCMGN